MDLDDLFEDLIPEKAVKKFKKKAKKLSFGRILSRLAKFLSELFGSKKQTSQPSYKKQQVEQKPAKKQAPSPYQRELQQAYDYRHRIEVMAQAAVPGSTERLRLDKLSSRVADWTHGIEEIIERQLDNAEDELIQAERKRVPDAIKRLEKELKAATDERVRQKLASTLANRQTQLAQFEQIDQQKQIAALKIENALAQLGIIYAQLQSGQWMRSQSSYERLSAEISDEVLGLEDYLSSWAELKQDDQTY